MPSGRKLTTLDFINKSQNNHIIKYDYSKVRYVDNKTKVEIICPVHGSFWQKPSNHLRGSNCPKCSKRNRKTTEQFIDEAKKTHGNKNDYSKIIYINKRLEIEIVCPIHGSFWQLPYVYLRGSGKCPICLLEEKTKTTEQFINEAKKVHNDKYDYSEVNYKTNKDKVEIICSIHGSFWQKPNDHLMGRGCPVCKNRKTTEQFIKEAREKHNNRYEYYKSIYTTSEEAVEIICPIHGSFFQAPHIHLRGSGCPVCNFSRGELQIAKELRKKKIKFVLQKRFKDCKNINTLPFDFYLPEQNTCIEYDGEQHFRAIEYFGGEEGLERRKKNDKIKNDFCSNKKMQLIRIPFFKYEEIHKIILTIV